MGHNGELALHSAGARNDQSFQGCSLTETCWDSIAIVLGTGPKPRRREWRRGREGFGKCLLIDSGELGLLVRLWIIKEEGESEGVSHNPTPVGI